MGKAYQALTAKTFTSIVATPMVQAADGSLGDTPTTSALTLTSLAAYGGVIEECEFDQEYEGEEVGMLSVGHADETSGAKRTVCTLTEVLKYVTGNGTGGTAVGNLLQQLFNNTIPHADGDDVGARIAHIKIRRGRRQFEFWMRMKNYRESYRKGKSVGVLTGTVLDPRLAPASHPSVTTY